MRTTTRHPAEQLATQRAWRKAFSTAKREGVRWVFVRVNGEGDADFNPRLVLSAAKEVSMPVCICPEHRLPFNQDLPDDIDWDSDDFIDSSGGRYIHVDDVQHGMSGFIRAMDIAVAAFDAKVFYEGYLVVPYAFPVNDLWDDDAVYTSGVVGDVAFGPDDFSLAELIDATESLRISAMVRFPHTSQHMYLTRTPETFNERPFAVWRSTDGIQVVPTEHPLGECPSCPSSNIKVVLEDAADDSAWDNADAIDSPWALEARNLYECQNSHCARQWHYIDLRF